MSAFLKELESTNAVLLVVDMQEKLLPAMEGAEACTAAVRKMVEAAPVLGVPVVVTEQYPAGLGSTCATVRESLRNGVTPIEKMRFSACVEATLEQLRMMNRRQVIVVGIETHVCVQQTVLDLLREDYTPYLCADAVTSRRALDRQMAIERMRQAGVIVTTVESVIFELLGEAGGEQFKRVLKIVK